MDDEFGYAGLKIFEGVDIELIPFFGSDAGLDGDGVIDDDIVGTESFFEVVVIGKPVARDEEGEFVVVRDAKGGSEKFGTVFDEAILVDVAPSCSGPSCSPEP